MAVPWPWPSHGQAMVMAIAWLGMAMLGLGHGLAMAWPWQWLGLRTRTGLTGKIVNHIPKAATGQYGLVKAPIRSGSWGLDWKGLAEHFLG